MVDQSLPHVIMIMGPTASGKTGLAVQLRSQFPVDLISVDSALVYRGMDVGTAKPDPHTLAVAPHRLIDIREPTEVYSAADFRDDALEAMAEITAAGRIPVLVGGTMLYFRALLNGISKLPAADPEVRQALEQEAAERGWAVMHQELAQVDPEAADRIHPNDPQRIERALEVYRISGQSMTELQKQKDEYRLPYRCLKIVVCPQPRAKLHQRIELRFKQMLEEGFLDEIKALYRRPDLRPELPSMRCVGYRQAWEWLDGLTTYDEMCARVVAATRQLAKRQLTWLRQEPETMWYDLDSDDAKNSVVQQIQRFLETGG